MAQQTVVTNVSIRVRRNSSRDRDKPKRARCQEGRNYRVWPAPSIRATNCLDRVSFQAQYSFLLFGPIRFSRFIFFFSFTRPINWTLFFKAANQLKSTSRILPQKGGTSPISIFFRLLRFLAPYSLSSIFYSLNIIKYHTSFGIFYLGFKLI